jgi:hypothetical protein
MNDEKNADASERPFDGLVMSTGAFLLGMRQLFPPPRSPQTKASLYALTQAYAAAPRWRQYILTRELRQDIWVLRHNASITRAG